MIHSAGWHGQTCLPVSAAVRTHGQTSLPMPPNAYPSHATRSADPMTNSANRSPGIVLSTWPFGVAANATAWGVLARGGTSLDAVQAGATQCEFDPSVDSVGLGGLPDAAGEVTL